VVADFMALNPLLLIHGGEAALTDRALSEALEARRDFERTSLDGGELEVGRYGEVIAPSLFSEKRVVILRDLQDVSAEVGEEILENFDAIDPNTHLIFVHRGGVKGKGLVEKIKKLKAEYIACEPLKKQSEKAEFVRQEFTRHGRKISSAAIAALVSATGSDTRELAAACSQISFDTNAGKALIDEGDIANYYQGRVEATGFDVADAVIAGDVRGTLISLRNALDTGTDPVMIVSAVANSVRALAKVSDLPRNAKSFEVAGKLGLAPWQIDKARRQLIKWRPGMITFAIEELVRADFGVKGGEAAPIYALERAMVSIAKNVASGGSV
jgi:DNA polymerase-3 subunit delta